MMKPFTLLILLFLAGVAKPTFAEACRFAPPPRLQPGASAVVAPGVGLLNLRALPALDTGVSVQLYSGNTLTVLGGPSCNGRINWWRVESANGTRGWVAEGTWAQYFVVPADDAQNPPRPLVRVVSAGVLRGVLFLVGVLHP